MDTDRTCKKEVDGVDSVDFVDGVDPQTNHAFASVAKRAAVHAVLAVRMPVMVTTLKTDGGIG